MGKDTLTTSSEDVLVQPNRSCSLSMFSCFSILLNGLIGIGIVSNGRHNRSGVAFNLIVNIIFALITYYSNYCISYVVSQTRSLSYEECWTNCGYKYPFVLSIGNFIPCVGFMSQFFANLHIFWVQLTDYIWPDCPPFLQDIYILSFIIIFILFIPMMLNQDEGYLAKLSHVSNLSLVAFAVLSIYIAVKISLADGFDPENSITIFDFSKDFLGPIGEYVGSYTTYCYYFISIKFLYNLTFRRAKKVIGWSLFTYCILTEIIGLASYFILYNDFDEKVFFLKLKPDNPEYQALTILFIIKTILSIPTLIDPMRISALYIVKISNRYPTFIWGAMAIIFMIVSLMFSTLSSTYMTALSGFLNAYVMMMQYVFPALMMIKKMAGKGKLHWVMIVLLIVLGFGFGIYSLIDFFTAFI